MIPHPTGAMARSAIESGFFEGAVGGRSVFKQAINLLTQQRGNIGTKLLQLRLRAFRHLENDRFHNSSITLLADLSI